MNKHVFAAVQTVLHMIENSAATKGLQGFTDQGQAIAYRNGWAHGIQEAKARMACLAQNLARPACDNCGAPASWFAYHDEAGPCYACDACAKSHAREYTRPRRIYFPEDPEGDTCGNCGGSVLRPLPEHADPCECLGRPGQTPNRSPAP